MKPLLTILLVLSLCGVGVCDDIDDLIPYIIQVESGGIRQAYNWGTGATGLFQITPIVVQEYNSCNNTHYKTEDMYYESASFQVGTWYLNRLKNHYLKDKYTPERLCAAYNGGITRLRKHNYDVSKMPRETRRYVKKVLKLWKDSK